ncbi:MAG: mechanosensitive ion channel [Anaerolineales bacterium]|nr:mechanosensitive ion channel [Anaerolineales bacterium]
MVILLLRDASYFTDSIHLLPGTHFDAADVSDGFQGISAGLEDLLASFILLIPNLIAALVIFILTLYVANLFSRGTRRALNKRQVNPQTHQVLPKIVHWSVIVFGLIVALQQVGFSVTAFLAGLGVIGFTVGFALQDISKNFVSGLIIWMQQPFFPGDLIEVTGFTGTVMTIDLRATELRTFDGRLVLIPNADVVTKPIINYSRTGTRRIEVQVSLSSQSDIELARQLAIKATGTIPGLLKQPAPKVVVQAFNSSNLDLVIYYWINANQTSVELARDNGITRIKSAFEKAGIQIL